MTVIQNVINANSVTPLPSSRGGSGVSSPTAHGVLIAEGAGAYVPIVLAAGQVLIGTTASDPSAASISAGSGISISSVSGAITISNSAAANAFVDQTSTPVTCAVNTTYLADNGATQTVFNLPTTSIKGDRLNIVGFSSGGWILNQAASQQVIFGNVSSTSGAGGSIASTLQNDSLSLLCVTANTVWTVMNNGNFNVV